MITLKQYTNEENQILPLIQGFWKAHSHYDQSGEEAQEDLTNWTKDGHIIYFIQHDETTVGFAHVGSRGGKIDWLEELFILPEYQGSGFGSEAIHQLEEIVQRPFEIVVPITCITFPERIEPIFAHFSNE